MHVKTANGSAWVNVTNQSLCRNIPTVARVEGISVQADLPQHYPLSHPLHVTQEGISIFCISQPRARICKPLRRPGIDSEDSIPPAYVGWRAGTTNRVVVLARRLGIDSWTP